MNKDKFGFTTQEREWMNAIFASIPHIDKVMLYGSRAKGNFRDFSDVDITLFGEDLTRDDLLDLKEKLDESNLPYLYDVSIFSKLTSKEFIDHIKRVGKYIYSRQDYKPINSEQSDKVAETNN